jgi:hypothetical protein
MKPGDRQRWAVRAAAGLLLAGIVAALYGFNPADVEVFPPCPFHHLTGLHCPGCGSLRAVHQLLRGRPAAAFSLNPLAVAAIPFLGAILLKPAWAYRSWVPWAVLSVILAYGVARNLPFWPLTLPSP